MAPGLFPAFSKPMVFEGAYPENEPVTTYIYICIHRYIPQDNPPEIFLLHPIIEFTTFVSLVVLPQSPNPPLRGGDTSATGS